MTAKKFNIVDFLINNGIIMVQVFFSPHSFQPETQTILP